MRLNLTFEPNRFAAQLAHEVTAGGLTVVDAIERILSECLEDSITQCLRGRIVKAPRSVVHPMYYVNRFQNLAALSRGGYATWYPEVRFATRKDCALDITSVEASGLELGGIRYGGGIEQQYTHKQKILKTQVNHTVRFSRLTISPDVFMQVVNSIDHATNRIPQPIIANLTVGCQNFVDDRIAGFRIVAFDHAVTGERRFCRCNSDAHGSMLSEAKSRASAFVPGSWPHRVVDLLERAAYTEGLCHFCVSERHGREAPAEWYGSQIRKHFGPYVDLLVRTKNMDLRTAKAETKRRLALSRWTREEELYELIRGLFPDELVRREASPIWLGRQRLDIYLPRVALAVEHQGEQHYRPIDVFGGEHAFARTRERDERKRALCRENGVAVVDIRFDDVLTSGILRRRLQRWFKK